MSEFEHRLCITTSSLLLTPSSAVGEVERAASAACVVLLEVVAVLNVVSGPRFGHERKTACVVILDSFAIPVVGPGVPADFLGSWVAIVADSNIDDDVACIVASIDALVDGAVYVEIPDGTTVGKDITLPLPWGECERD